MSEMNDVQNASGRVLTQEERGLIGDVRQMSALVNELLTDLEKRNHAAMEAIDNAGGPFDDNYSAVNRSNESLYEARRALRTGFMYLTRSIANPVGL